MKEVTWRPSPTFYVVPKKRQGWTKSIQTPVPLRPPAGRNPDWSIPMIFMQLTTQLIHCQVLICIIIICYTPVGNIIILLSLVSCLLSLVSCLLSLVSCLLSLVSCLLSLVSCLLSLVSCLLSLVSRLWSLVSCLLSLVSCLLSSLELKSDLIFIETP